MWGYGPSVKNQDGDHGGEHAPHGGTWVETGEGSVEISVFETNVPPRFRLFFFDKDLCPQAPKSGEVTIETTRPGGAKQIFQFRRDVDYLESDAEIPEPHEFIVTLNVVHGDHQHSYKAKLTESGHGHGHAPHDPHGSQDHGHSQGEDGHSHDHGNGILGWFRGTFAHSHRAADKIDESMDSNAQDFTNRTRAHSDASISRRSSLWVRRLAR